MPQKLKHIQSCAKKLQIFPDTLQHLLHAELERIKQLPPEESSKKGKGKLPEVQLPVQPGTLLEDALDGGGKKKPGPRRKVVESVKELHETRQDILDRAKQLLGGSTRPTPHAVEGDQARVNSPPRTQPFGQSRLAQRYVPTTALDQTQLPIHVPDSGLAGPSHRSPEAGTGVPSSPPRTQPFGGSALAKKFGKARALEDSLYDEHWAMDDAPLEPHRSPSRSPPRTQPFGESALAKRFGKKRETQPTSLLDAVDIGSPIQSPQATRRHIFNEVSNSSPPRRAATPSSDDSDVDIADAPLPGLAPPAPNPVSTPLLQCQGLHSRLQTSPAPPDAHSSSALGPWSLPPQNSARDLPAPSGSDSPGEHAWGDVGEWQEGGALDGHYHDEYAYDGAVIHYEPVDDVVRDEPPPRRRRSASPAAQPKRAKAKAKPKKGAEGAKLTDAELHAQLRARIERDTALYHRVLRYEVRTPFSPLLAESHQTLTAGALRRVPCARG